MLHDTDMMRDYGCMRDMYIPSHDLHAMQIPQTMYPHINQPQITYYNMHGPSATSAPYEMTSVAGGSAEGSMAPVQHPHQQQHTQQMHLAQLQPMHVDPRKRKNPRLDWASCSSTETAPYEMTVSSDYVSPQPPPPPPRSNGGSRKRRPSSYGTSSAFDDDGTEDSRSSRTAPDKKQNHSEIEKRRRDKMNTYITELSSMIPMCGAMARKLDKLTVLRIAVQHLRVVRGALTACPLTARPTPNILSERELNALVLNAAHDCFLMVVGCDRGRLMFVSATVKNMLHYNQSELLGQSLFDLLHPKDVAKVKEQLSSLDLNPRERLVDAKTMLPLKSEVITGVGNTRLCPGARRSFFCRIKTRPPNPANRPRPLKQEDGQSRNKKLDKKYCVVQCTGYLKYWCSGDGCEAPCVGPPNTGEAVLDPDDASNMSCLVAVARALPDLAPEETPAPAPAPRKNTPNTRPIQFISRHATDGKYLFVDHRVTLALGFLPQELLGTSLYEYVRGPGVASVACAHKQALLRNQPQHTPAYSFKKKDGTLARVRTHFKPFRNPWTKDVEYLVANNTLIAETPEPMADTTSNAPFELFKHEYQPVLQANAITESDTEMQRLIETQVETQLESHKIGSAIAEEVLRRSSPEFSPDLPPDMLQDAVFIQQQPLIDTILSDVPDYTEIRNNVSLNSTANPSDSCGEDFQNGQHTDFNGSLSPPIPPLAIDGNGEAAMAVIMSLLEADAGLGGPVNFSGLPWPLP